MRRSKARAFSPRSLTQEVGIFCRKNDISLRAGFEPAREDPIGFQVQRLNHSAITALECNMLQNDLVIVNASAEFNKSQQNTVCGGVIMIPIKRQRPKRPRSRDFL